MKKTIINYLTLLTIVFIWVGCDYDDKYGGGAISPYISNFDLRKIYRGSDVQLNTESLKGASFIRGIVVSDHSGKNMPAGLVAVQNTRPVASIDSLRGISFNIGADAANYVPGDSVHVKIDGAVLTKIDGILQITGLPAGAITKVASNRPIPVNRVSSSSILKSPGDYESTLVAIVKAGFDPVPTGSDTYKGDKVINDGFDNFTLHTEANATFANATGLNFNANYYGVVYNTLDDKGNIRPQHRIRTLADVRPLSSVPEISPVLIAGYIANPIGGDGDYEYMQFLATQDINFATTPFSVIVTNNAGGSTPGGFPVNGWATGGGSLAGPGGNPAATGPRTYKFKLTSGTVTKGQFFYVGGSKKLINGSASTNISTSKWIRAFNYTTTDGDDGIGRRNGGLFANSGNASGFAIFKGTTVTKDTAPVDCIFIASGGSIFDPSAMQGYKIGNTDFYDIINPITLQSQPYYRQGTNTINFGYNATEGIFFKLGGIYNPRLGKWVKARTQNDIPLSKTSSLGAIEGPSYLEWRDSDTNELIKTDTINVTSLKD